MLRRNERFFLFFALRCCVLRQLGGGGGDGCNKKMMQKIPFEFVWQCLFTFLYSIIRKVITFFFGAKTVTFSGSCQGAGKYIKKNCLLILSQCSIYSTVYANAIIAGYVYCISLQISGSTNYKD